MLADGGSDAVGTACRWWCDEATGTVLVVLAAVALASVLRLVAVEVESLVGGAGVVTAERPTGIGHGVVTGPVMVVRVGVGVGEVKVGEVEVEELVVVVVKGVGVETVVICTDGEDVGG